MMIFNILNKSLILDTQILQRIVRKSILLVFLTALAVGITSCKKEEGKGGKLTIKGKVYALFYDEDLNHKTSEAYLADHDVYIIYGDQSGYGDKVSTAIDGSFEFTFLRKGKYTIYTYSKDTTKTAPEGHVSVSVEVNIENDKDLGDLVVVEEERRLYRIKGKVKAQYYSLDRLTMNSEAYIYDQEVYAVNTANPYHSIRERTNSNGSYEFRDLPAGNYRIYTIYKDFFGETSNGNAQTSKDTVVVSSDVIMNDLVIKLEDEKVYPLKGHILMLDYDISSTDPFYANDIDVYLTYGTDPTKFYSDRIRTLGTVKPFYEFMVPNGTYIVSVISKDPAFTLPEVVMYDTVVVNNGPALVPDLMIYDY